MEGLHQKYMIHKADGSPVDPEADYFVLRLDKDPHARKAALQYALSVRKDNRQLHDDIVAKLESYKDTTTLKTYDIWVEGYRITGDSGEAHIIGQAQGHTFREACDSFFSHSDSSKLYNSQRLSYWGCRLYDNELQARASFG